MTTAEKQQDSPPVGKEKKPSRTENRPASLTMSAETFRRFSEYIQGELGIKMLQNKQVMLQARLMKRLRALGIGTYEEYYEYLFSEEGHERELPFFVHQVTTNKTDFFREPAHFRYMKDYALPDLLGANSYSRKNPLQVWSAACSSGEEPYTLAMVLAEYADESSYFPFRILATDISPTVLQTAARGVYDHSKVEPVPHHLRRKYLLRSKDRKQDMVKIVPELRARVVFQWTNLKSYPFVFDEKMDIIFCRNVIIYFSRETQQYVINNLCAQLKKGGYLFMGHSETLSGFRLPLMQVATTIYRKI